MADTSVADDTPHAQARALIVAALRNAEIPLSTRALTMYGLLADAVLASFEVIEVREIHAAGRIRPWLGAGEPTHTRLVLRTHPEPIKEASGDG